MNQPLEKTTVELTNEDATLFVEFQKRYQFMKLLKDMGVFELRGGHVTIHFSNLGEIMGVDIQRHIKVII